MAIRRSLAADIRELVDQLGAADARLREAAGARLAAIGQRAVPHLVDAFPAASGAVARTAILRALEPLHDRRGLALALDVLADPARDPGTAAAAIALLGTFLDGESTHALETLGSVAVDAGRPDLERLAAWQMLEHMPERILAPLRGRLARDASAAVRRQAGAPRQGGGEPAPLDPTAIVDAAAAGQETDPAVVAAAVGAVGATAPLGTLHRLVEHARQREAGTGDPAERQAWVILRGAAHAALAARRSRVALYDARETVAAAAGALPEGFTLALARVGDAASLDAIADALARMPAGEPGLQDEWRGRLLDAGRAILDRERLTRRHAAVRRLVRLHPAAAQALFG